MKRITPLVVVFLAYFLLPATGYAQITAGFIENAWIGDPAINFAAKLDTGAKTSSINAHGYTFSGVPESIHVHFTITNRAGKRIVIKAPVSRFTTIHRANAKAVQRAVIRLKLCVAGATANSEFTLADRSNMSYQLLIGRSFLKNRLLVNSGKTHLHDGRCEAR